MRTQPAEPSSPGSQEVPLSPREMQMIILLRTRQADERSDEDSARGSPDLTDEIAHGDEDALATRLTGPSPEMEERLRRAEQNLRI